MYEQITFYTSFLFLVESVLMCLFHEYIYSFLFGVLFITSLLYRVYENLFTTLLENCVAARRNNS